MTGSHQCSFNTLFTPFPRLYLSGTFSCTDTHTRTALDGSNGLVPWQSRVYSLISSATYAANTNTDLFVSGVFSKTDPGRNNPATGLPAGINYRRVGLQIGVTRRWPHHLITHVTGGLDQYREPTAGGLNDFTAETVLATISMPLP